MSPRVPLPLHAGSRTHRPQALHFLALCVLALLTGCGRAATSEPRAATEPATEVVQAPATFSVRTSSADRLPLSPGQQALRARLEEQAAAERPTHRVTLQNGRVVEGRVLTQTSDSIRLREGFGFSGYVISPYKRSEITGIETLPARPFEITRRDLKLCEEFPRYHFAKVPPYSFVTDESYGDVEKLLRLLTDLRQQFSAKFAPLISDGAGPQDIQVVFFGSENSFRDYTRRIAPALIGSAGFYSAGNNRLALLNQLATQHYADAGARLAKHQRQLNERRDVDPRDQYQASRRLSALRSGITYEAKSMTERLVRHEGAHQLFHSYGIHSRSGLEPTWLTEGLAEYCEPSVFGGYHFALAERLARLRQSHSLLPLKTLLAHHDAAGFFSLGEDGTDAAYAQSWALVYFLMQDEFRSRFFDYIKRNRALEDPIADPAALLESCLKINLNTLETQWQTFLNRM